jgi:ankyrin repeat protein
MSPPTEADTPVADMDAKLMVATGSGGIQQLKDLVNKQEEQDSEVMVVVMAKKQAAPPAEKPHMDPHLLALASSGSFEELKSLLSSGISSSDQKRQTNLVISEEGQASGDNGSTDDDIEANKSILSGVTAEGNTALHVVAACGQGDNFLKSARIIHEKDKDLLFAQNSNGDTPLHCATRAGKYDMVNCLIHLAFDEGGEGKMNALLWKENKDKGTTLLEAVRIGNNHIVDLLMDKDSELASIPEDGGTSPMYLGIVLKRDEIVKILYDKSSPGKLSFAGPNRQNALHAAVLRYPNKYRHRGTHACIFPFFQLTNCDRRLVLYFETLPYIVFCRSLSMHLICKKKLWYYI